MEKLINLINALNEMYAGDNEWFRYEEIAGRLYIYGQSQSLAILFGLLWSKATNYALYLEKDNKLRENFIEVIKLYD